VSGRFRELLHRLVAGARHRSLDRDLDDELAWHVEEASRALEQAGLPPAEARRRALVDLGGLTGARERHRDARGLPRMSALLQDIRYALRGLRREPGYTVAAILILALGIGANTAVFSVINPLLLRPLPFAEARDLVWLAGDGDGLSSQTYSVNVLEAMQERTQSLSALSAFFAFFDYESQILTGEPGVESLVGVRTAPGFFELLGISPARGRLFSDVESAPGGPQAAVISHGLWQRRYGAREDVMGQTVRLNDAPVTIVGVLPRSFDFGAVFAPGTTVDVFLPADFDVMRPWGNVFSVVGRLAPGQTVDSARAEFATLLGDLRRDFPENGCFDIRVSELSTRVTGSMRRPLVVVWGAVGLVLLIACANLSNLLLARMSGRRREIAIRLALGASRGRVVRQLLTEGLVLATGGALAGLPTAYLLTDYLRTRTTLSLPLVTEMEVDLTSLVFAACVAIVTGVVFSALPALRASRHDPQTALQDRGRGSTDGRWHGRVRSGLVIGEVAVACVLLVGAGLLVRSFIGIVSIDTGFEPAGAVTLRLDRGPRLSVPERAARLVGALERVTTLPGVSAAGITDALPLSRNRSSSVSVPDRIYDDPSTIPVPFLYVVSTGYFEAMGIELVRGRDFATSDDAESPLVAIPNERLAAELWPGRDPVGRDLRVYGEVRRIIGVARDVRQTSLDEAPVGQAYLPITQVDPAGSPNLVIRSDLPAATTAGNLRAAFAASDPVLVAAAVTPVNGLVDRVVSPRRFLLLLIGGFAVLAVLLAGLGLYAVVAYAVSQQTRDIGIRIALGAGQGDVYARVMLGTARLAIAGIACGLLGAFALTRLIASLLYETSPVDPLTFVAVPAGLLAVALAAGFVPARRASNVDPILALRAE
jgi:predicted permease